MRELVNRKSFPHRSECCKKNRIRRNSVDFNPDDASLTLCDVSNSTEKDSFELPEKSTPITLRARLHEHEH